MIVKELLVTLGVDVKNQGFKRGEQYIDGLRGKLGALAGAFGLAFGIDAFVGAIKGSIQAGAAVDDLSQKVGVNAQALQALQYAAEQSGVDAGQFAQGLSFLTRMAGEASQGNEAAAKTFAQFGIALRGSNGEVRAADDLLNDIADRIQKARTPTEKLAIATSFLGARNGQLAVTLKDGAAGLQAMRAEAEALGAVLDAETVAALAKADDDVNSLSRSFGGFKAMIAAEVAPWLSRLVEWLKASGGFAGIARKHWADLTKVVGSAIKTFRQLLPVLLGAAGGLAALWIAQNAVGLQFAFIALMSNFAGLAAVRAAVMSAAAWVAAALPVVALGVVIGLLVEELEALFTDKDGLFEVWAGKWDELSVRIADGIDPKDNALVKTLKYAASYLAYIVGAIDSVFDRFASAGADLSIAPETFAASMAEARTKVRLGGAQALYDNQGRLVSTLNNGAFADQQIARPSAAAEGVANIGRNASGAMSADNSVTVNIDASGQVLDEAAMMTLAKTAALEIQEQSLQHAFAAGTPQ